MKPKLLLTNDDSISAPGLRFLYQALAPLADITIVAPEVEQSGVGLSITLRRPLMLHPVEWQDGVVAMKLDGTPADCVRIALNRVMDGPPDLIVAGINNGATAGRNALYSGTVGGVIEGAIRGLPGIAFSCQKYGNPNYEETLPYVQSIVEHVLSSPLPRGNILNVNFPEKNGIKGVKLASQGRSYVKEKLQERIHPDGNAYFWTGYEILDLSDPEGTDIYWLDQGYASVVPLHVDEITNHNYLEENKAAFEGLVPAIV